MNILKFFVNPVLKDIAVGKNLPTTQYVLIDEKWWKVRFEKLFVKIEDFIRLKCIYFFKNHFIVRAI